MVEVIVGEGKDAKTFSGNSYGRMMAAAYAAELASRAEKPAPTLKKKVSKKASKKKGSK